MAKNRIIEALGEDQLLLPGLVTEGLAANDRVKYLLALLQYSAAAADGAQEISDLRGERIAAGIDEPALDAVVSNSSRSADGRYSIPGAERLVERALADVGAMVAPLSAAGSASAAKLTERAEAVRAHLQIEGDRLDANAISRLAGGHDHDRDTLHVVVIDAHRELNALAGSIATESIDGAQAHGLDSERDTRLVRAFMRGLHATERLRFDHPGLGTLATRVGDALVVQNDLGTTDAHVVVIRVTGDVVTITYTDVHLQRLLFFQDLLAGWDVSWDDTRSRQDRTMEEGLYHLAGARFTAATPERLDAFLEHLGSRLVFMIDWNRARKRLRRLVGRRGAVELLRWAADNDYGHMAFLRAGGDALIYDALEFAEGRLVRAGESLEDVLGSAGAMQYLRAVMRICAVGLLGGSPISLVQDEVRAELTGYVRSARQEILALALRHAELCVEIAEAARDALERAIAGAPDRVAAAATRAERGEHDADVLVQEARAAVARAPDLEPFLALVGSADDIADSGEEAAFYATLLPDGQPGGDSRAQVRRIARLVLSAAREYLRAVALSVELRRGGPREDMDAFLAAVHSVIALERETDEAQRAIHKALAVGAAGPDAALFVIVELTRSYEEGADALMHSAQLLRDHTLERVVRSETAARRASDQGAHTEDEPETALREEVYVIGEGAIPGPDEIGGKAHGLARLQRAGLRVPEAAVLKTALCRRGADEDELRAIIEGALARLTGQTGLRLGSARRPLLVSVRSGAPISMPGMLETVLNVGLCDATLPGLITMTGNPRLAWDCYRRLVESYAAVVHNCPRTAFDAAVARRGGTAELGAAALERLTREHLGTFARLTGTAFPQDPMTQLTNAATAVFASWQGPKAREYRRLHGIDDGLGTAVIVQRMVFGNAGGVSGAGVGFTRDPALGTPGLYLDFLLDSQGEDVVGGRRAVAGSRELGEVAPELLVQIEAVCPRLEAEFEDAQEFELTVQEGELFLLQARAAKCTPWARLRIATDLVREGLISADAALARLQELDLERIRRVHVADGGAAEPLCTAIPAGSGVAVGPLALDRSAAERIAGEGTPPVLVRADTVTEDVAAVALAAGLLTAAGGRTSHAAVVARELGKPCLVGCADLELDLGARTARIGGRTLAEGEVICIDAESGRVFGGRPDVIEERPQEALDTVAGWRAARA